MKGYLKKAILFITAASVAASLMAGCNTGKTGDKNASSDKIKDDAPVTGLPIVDKPLTLKYWGELHVQAAQYIRDHNENEAYQEAEKRTGIHIEFIHPASGQINEQFNLMIASGDLPDMIQTASKYKGGLLSAIEDKVYYDATPDLPKYAPDYYKLINSDPDIKRGVTLDNGSTPAFYRIKPNPDPPWRRLIARKEWLSELGLQVPKTFDEWETYFKSIKEKKNIPNPFFLAPNGIENIIVGAFGILPDYFLKDGKTIDYGKIQPAFKDYLALMNKWYSYGYIAKDFVATKEQQQHQQFLSGRAGAVIGSVDSLFNDTRTAGIEMQSAPFPRIKATDILHWQRPEDPVGGQETVVTDSCKYKKEAIRWLNYAYTKEGSMLFNYGLEGKSYVMEGGKPKFTDYMLKNPKYPLPSANYILKVHFMPKLSDQDLECNPSVLADPAGVANRKMWADDKNVDGLIALPPGLKLTLEESTARAQLMTDINGYANQMILKFIVGSEPLSKFDEYVKQIKDLGIAEGIKITQGAYDRYMKN